MLVSPTLDVVAPARTAAWHVLWTRSNSEKLVADQRLVLADELAARKDEWDRAARATPHGQPIELPG